MNKQVSQDGKSFSLDINSSEFSSVRVPVCYVSFPNSSNQQFDASEYVQQLGKINLSINVDAVSYYNRQPDVTITNKVVSKQIEVPQNDVNFKPCLLDFDGDGIVSKSDIDKIYSKTQVPLKFDLNGDGIVTEADRLLALEYVGTACLSSETPSNPQSINLVLDLEGSNYDGSGVWLDASGNDYHFSAVISANGNAIPPIKNEDGSVTVGRSQILDSDTESTSRSFQRVNVVEYESDKSFTSENIENQTATTEGVYREKYIPDVDQDYSFEFVFKFTDGVPQGSAVSGGARFKVFGYANYGTGGYNFGSGYSNAQYASDPDVFIPYYGLGAQTYAGLGVDAEPGSPDYGLPHPSDYPNPLPYSLKVQQLSTGNNNRYRGGSAILENFNLGLNNQSGLSDGSVFYVQYVVSPSTQTVKFYANGVELPASINTPVGIGLPQANADFVIGKTPQGGWSSPKAIDIFALKVYDGALNEEQVLSNYNNYLQKYGS